MKKLLFAGCFCLALVRTAPAQDAEYVNNGNVTNAITIDAINFINNGLFAIPVNSIVSNLNAPLLRVTLANPTVTAFDFSDVQNYTNNGFMACDTGFIFDTAPASFGSRHMAANFVNANPALISAGSFTNIFTTNFTMILGVGPKLTISATNVVNTGVLNVGLGGLLSVSGRNVDLSHGTMKLEGFDETSVIFGGIISNGFLFGAVDLGVMVTNWGGGQQVNQISLGNLSPPPISPVTVSTNVLGGPVTNQLILSGGSAFANVNVVASNDITYQVVYLQDTLGQVNTDVRFVPSAPFGIPTIRWFSVYSNLFTGQPATNNLFLEDLLDLTNAAIVTNPVFSLNPGRPAMPVNYVYSRTYFGYESLPAGNTPFSTAIFNNGFTPNIPQVPNNGFSRLGVHLAPTSLQPDPTIPTQNVTNVGGRIEIAADVLDLSGTILDGANYVRLTTTNHFAGSAGARMVFPFADISLRSSNGVLNLTNVLAPNVPRLAGPIECYSATWSNVSTATFIDPTGASNTFPVNNRYHVLMVVSSLSATSPAIVKDLVLRNTNGNGDLFISDIVNVSNSLFMDTRSLTITSNAPGAPTPTGQLNFLSTGLIWSSSLSTNLKYLTNLGLITAPNAVFFQKRLNPNFPLPADGPYSNFVNHGTISTGGGDIIWADNVENSGSVFAPASIISAFGPITVQSTTAGLSNGAFTALNIGAIDLTSGSLSISNHALVAGGALSVSGTNLLTDAGSSNNVWLTGNGFNMPVRPAIGDLRNTTVSNTVAPGLTSQNVWAGAVISNLSTSGFNNVLPAMSNNAPVGRLVLRGGSTSSAFHFKGPNNDTVNPYALYVDQLELKDGATNRSGLTFTALNVDTNVTIFFLDAVIGANDISEKLNGANGGRLIWLSNYVGRFSATNITYPDAQTFQFNRGLAQSLTLDSDNDGTVNGIDPTPFPEPFSASSIALTISVAHSPAIIAQITWQSPALSTNYLYYRSLTNTNWLTLTNFVKSASTGPVQVTDPVLSGRLYKVRIDPLQ